MKILDKYITRELLIPFVVLILILSGLFSSFSSARFLAEAVTESLGVFAMLELVGLKTLIALEVLVPISLYIAVIIGLGRMNRDQEINILRSAGISEYRIIYTVLIVAIPVGIISGVLSMFARPWAYEESYILNAQAEAELNTDRFQAGRFYGNEKSGRVVYIDSKDKSGKVMKNIFHFVSKEGGSEVLFAKEGIQKKPVRGERPQLHLFDGNLYKLKHDNTKDTVSHFEKLVYFGDDSKELDYKRKSTSTRMLMESDRAPDVAELQWRLSRPVSTILLALIAIPFSRISSRNTKGERMYFYAALVFAIYYILSGLAQTWVEQGKIGSIPGVWWLYVLMSVVSLSLLFPNGWKQFFRSK
ncbi:MAG: LPS export ABC transporter permease LptF [Nitrosomonadaceae bacterium]|nr:LPS export ABC transporter permease LptF [Nitrosomonadaceae bacterium]|tara:strand:- start:205 stop:1281 length:1077 start_codon:yes stop_codon:yes gene_type:complete